MSTLALVDLVCHLYEESYGVIGAKILRYVLNKSGSTLVEIVKHTKLPVSTVQRTLVSLVTNRFVIFWNGPKTRYFGNWRQVYTTIWCGELLNDEPEVDRKLLLQAITDGLIPQDQLPKDVPKEVIEKHLRIVSDWEFWSEEELKLSLEQKCRTTLSNDPAVYGKSEAAKKQLIAEAAKNELEKVSSNIGSPNSPQQYYVINWDKFLIKARRKELVSYAARVVGSVTSKLYEIVLTLSEKSIHKVKQPYIASMESTVTTQTIIGHLNEEFIAELKQVFAERSETTDVKTEIGAEGDAKRSKLNAGNAKSAALASMSPAELVNKHLQLLESVKTSRFIQRVGGRQQGEWFVPFDRVIEDLQRSTLDEIISQSLGESAARLIRLIRSSGKLDEKILANQALLPALEIRHQMSALANFGFADIQELAKPNERGGALAGAQKRSVFLWYHRPKWAYSCLLDLLYKQLDVVLHELSVLRKNHDILLAKLTREDVISDMDQFLTEKEHKELEEYRNNEKELYKRMNMIDRSVRIFREY